MSPNITTTNNLDLIIVFCLLLCGLTANGQEVAPDLSSRTAYHNQLFFNRFLINPTFSLVRENKSYLNILHRNQYATFEDNSQNYFLGFSNKLNERTALGISVYSQWAGVVQEFGFNANYATSVKLGSKSSLAFGTNVTYFNEGLDRNRVVATEGDEKIIESGKESKIAIQPGITLSMGRFDFGVYAENLFKYNQTKNIFLTNLNDKSIKATLQYTHPFTATRGLFADARLMPLVQMGKNADGSLAYVGSLLLDLPSYGWLLTNYDDTYGASVGLGFNINKKMSLGYLLEKDLTQDDADFGWNHEVSLAYTFKSDDEVKGFADNSDDARVDQVVRNYEEQILNLIADRDKLREENKKILSARAKSEATEVAYEKRPNRKTKAKIKAEVDKAVEDSQNFAYETRPKRSARSKRKAEVDKNAEDSHWLAYENRLILDELILRQDSIEAARTAASEKRFAAIVRVLRNDIKYNFKAHFQDLNKDRHTLMAKNGTKPEMSEKIKTVYVAAETKPQRAQHIDKVLVGVETKPIRLLNYIGMMVTAQTIPETFKTLDPLLIKVDKRPEPELKVNTMVAAVEAIPDKTKSLNTIEHKDFIKLPIANLGNSDIVGAKSGYYVIANVYRTKKYLKAFMNSLSEQGLEAKQFYNKNNGLYYVYLADYNFKEEAKTAYVSDLDGKYHDEKWIMEVADNSAIVNNYYVD
ncbi:MAG: PorP/SprF family type IX secretion system membrane protein [Aurantibacter sp.]